MRRKPDPAALALALEARYLAAGNHVPPDSWPEPLRLQELVRTLFPARKKLGSLCELRQAFIPVFRDVWLRAGLAAGPTDRPACEAAARLAYQCAGLKPPAVIVWLRSPLEGAVGAVVLKQVWAQVGAQVGDQVGDQVRAQVNKAGYGSHDANWLAFYSYFHSVGIPGLRDKLAGLWSMSRCGWWWPFKGAVILTDLPTRLEMREGKLVVIEYADGFRVGGTT